MRLLYLVLLTLLSFSIYGQESNVYTEDGILKIDSSYSIKSDRIKDFMYVERYAFPSIYNSISYPLIALESAIDGVVIVKVVLNKDKFECYVVKSTDKTLNESVISAVNRTSKYIQYLTDNFKMPFEFYVPIKFEFSMDNYRRDLYINKAITIKGTSSTKQIMLIKEY
jgi:hypothetical protein